MKRTLLVSFYCSLTQGLTSISARARAYDTRLRRAPARLAKVSLACSLLALVATSAPPEWNVEDEARQLFTFVPGQANKRVTAATVIYRTPRGTWPFSVTHDVHVGALSDDYSRPAAARDPVSADSVLFEQTSHLDGRTRLSTKTSSENAFEVVCNEAQCEGSLELDLSIAWNSSLAPAEPGVTGFSDAGSAPADPPVVTLRASFFGGSDKPMFGCDAQDSSNDLEEAPKKLGVDVTMLPFQVADDAGVVPGAPVDASAAVPLPVGLDASLVAPQVSRPDAGL